MSDPDVRVVVKGIVAAQEKIEHLRRQRRTIERMVGEVRIELQKIDRALSRLEVKLRRNR